MYIEPIYLVNDVDGKQYRSESPFSSPLIFEKCSRSSPYFLLISGIHHISIPSKSDTELLFFEKESDILSSNEKSEEYLSFFLGRELSTVKITRNRIIPTGNGDGGVILEFTYLCDGVETVRTLYISSNDDGPHFYLLGNHVDVFNSRRNREITATTHCGKYIWVSIYTRTDPIHISVANYVLPISEIEIYSRNGMVLSETRDLNLCGTNDFMYQIDKFLEILSMKEIFQILDMKELFFSSELGCRADSIFILGEEGVVVTLFWNNLLREEKLCFCISAKYASLEFHDTVSTGDRQINTLFCLESKKEYNFDLYPGKIFFEENEIRRYFNFIESDDHFIILSLQLYIEKLLMMKELNLILKHTSSLEEDSLEELVFRSAVYEHTMLLYKTLLRKIAILEENFIGE